MLAILGLWRSTCLKVHIINEIDSGTTLGGPLPVHLWKRDPTGSSGSSRVFQAPCQNDNGGRLGISYESLRYPTISDWTVDETRYDNCYDARFVLDCSDGRIGTHSIPNLRFYVSKLYHP
jgi:hypothetical protein